MQVAAAKAKPGSTFDVTCDVLMLSSSNTFPLYMSCDVHIMQSTEGSKDFILTLRHTVPKPAAGAKQADNSLTAPAGSASGSNVDDILDYINNAPIALQFMSATGT